MAKAQSQPVHRRAARLEIAYPTFEDGTFEAAEHALDDVALLVDRAVVIVLDLAVLAGWDDGLGATLDQPFPQRLAVVALVGDQFGRRWHRLDAKLRDLAIVHVSGRQE